MRKLFIHDTGFQIGMGVRLIDVAPLPQRNTHGRKIIARDGKGVMHDNGCSRRNSITRNDHDFRACILAQRHPVDNAHGSDAGLAADFLI